MNELVKITEQNGQRAVSARELHQFLEIGRDFSTWIKGRIEEYGFIEHQTLRFSPKLVKTPLEDDQQKNMPLPLIWQKNSLW